MFYECVCCQAARLPVLSAVYKMHMKQIRLFYCILCISTATGFCFSFFLLLQCGSNSAYHLTYVLVYIKYARIQPTTSRTHRHHNSIIIITTAKHNQSALDIFSALASIGPHAMQCIYILCACDVRNAYTTKKHEKSIQLPVSLSFGAPAIEKFNSNEKWYFHTPCRCGCRCLAQRC